MCTTVHVCIRVTVERIALWNGDNQSFRPRLDQRLGVLIPYTSVNSDRQVV